MSDKNTTHFGYNEVDTEAKAGMVAEVFHSVASRYDLMNDLMSAGIHRVWKRFTIELSGVRRGNAVLDIAGGTGDLGPALPRSSAPPGAWCWRTSTTPCSRLGATSCSTTACWATSSLCRQTPRACPFPTTVFDCVTIAFGLRNVTDKDAALRPIAARAQARRAPAGTGSSPNRPTPAEQGLRHLFLQKVLP